MLNKNEIINELKNEDFIVRNAIYEYVCNLHLYDDKDMNKALIYFLKNNYNLGINYAGLIYSRLNKDIIECLIQIYLNEKDQSIKENIGYVLVNHYELIKDLDYKFEDIFQDEYNLVLYIIMLIEIKRFQPVFVAYVFLSPLFSLDFSSS